MKIKGISLLSLFLLIACKDKNKLNQYILQGNAQGSTFSIKYIASSQLQLQDDVTTILEDIDNSMSTYKENSIISRINKGDSTAVVDTYFKDVFEGSKQVWQQSNGYFDPTVGPLIDAYGFGSQKKQKPLDSLQIDSVLNYVGLEKVEILPDGRFKKQFPQTQINFNAIAQGYTVDVLAGFLRKKGINDFIVELGGEMVVEGSNATEEKPLVLGIDDPLQTPEKRTLIAKIKFTGRAMATSGNYRKVITDPVSGEKFVHIINPRTGYNKKGSLLSVTVLAPNCMLADAYATTLMLMDLDEAKGFLKKLEGLDALILYMDANNSLQQYATPGFKKLMVE